MIIVTGGAGFIGSNIVAALNDAGRSDILVVDDLSDGHKFRTLVGLRITDYLDKDVFLDHVTMGRGLGPVEAIVHQGACTDTTEWDGRYMMAENFDYSKALLAYAQARGIPFVYASSGAVYGVNERFDEAAAIERPANVYGWSKWLFDRYLLDRWNQLEAQVVGFRYFNVYGPNERHKGKMASLVLQWHDQLTSDGTLKLFGASHGVGPGEQQRDFVFVDDVAQVNLWALSRPDVSGIFNLGTGRKRSFNDLARSVIDWHGQGEITYVPFPDHLMGSYQAVTEADLGRLRSAGCDHAFRPIEDGVPLYLSRLTQSTP
ncbi:MAG: ADP-glyceromanno-heptose 6-epimerase [Pseudomonadota bacterium]